MNWDYIAGFTDGEGYIGVIGRGPRINWGQKRPEVLEEIKMFLESNGLNPILYKRPNSPKNKSISMLVMGRRDEIEFLISKIYPSIVVKREDCDRVLMWMKNNPRKWNTGDLDKDEIASMIRDGFTKKEISRRLGCSEKKLDKYLVGVVFVRPGLVVRNGRRVKSMTEYERLSKRRLVEKSAECVDCGKNIYIGGKRCQSCNMKHRWAERRS